MVRSNTVTIHVYGKEEKPVEEKPSIKTEELLLIAGAIATGGALAYALKKKKTR